jgi:hypothetical protein
MMLRLPVVHVSLGASLPWTAAHGCPENPVAAAMRQARRSKKIVDAVYTRSCEQHVAGGVTQVVCEGIISGGVELLAVPAAPAKFEAKCVTSGTHRWAVLDAP